MKNVSLVLATLFCINLYATDYIGGDAIRNACNHIVDETGTHCTPALVQKGDSIFVKTDHLNYFFREIHPKINTSYILVTGNCDDAIVEQHRIYLDDPKIAAWFAMHPEIVHPKLIPIPIGICYSFYSTRKFDYIDYIRASVQQGLFSKKHLVSLNFATGNCPSERQQVFDLFANKSYCMAFSGRSVVHFLIDLAESTFVFSPRGRGPDCFRTWEALLVGSYPIVKTCALDSMYKDLPVIIVNEWTEVTEQFLELKYKELKSKSYNYEKLFTSYWIDYIKTTQINCRNMI